MCICMDLSSVTERCMEDEGQARVDLAVLFPLGVSQGGLRRARPSNPETYCY